MAVELFRTSSSITMDHPALFNHSILCIILYIIHISCAQTNFLCDYGQWSDNGVVTWTPSGCTLNQNSAACGGVGLTWYTNAMAWQDYTIQATMRLPARCSTNLAGGAGIVFRYQNDQKHYMFNISPDFGSGYQMSIWKVDIANGCYPPDCRFKSSQTDLLLNTNYNLRIEVEGDTFSVFVDNAPIWSVTDATFSYGTFGFRVWQASAVLSGLYVTTPSPTDSPTPSPTPAPTPSPTPSPTRSPTSMPTPAPTSMPTANPTKYPTNIPSESPTKYPTKFPTNSPTFLPSNIPSLTPSTMTQNPSLSPTHRPMPDLVLEPTFAPTHVSDGEVMESTVEFESRTVKEGPLWFLGLDVLLQYIIIIGGLGIVMLLIVGVTVCCVCKMRQSKSEQSFGRNGNGGTSLSIAGPEGFGGTTTRNVSKMNSNGTVELIHNSKQNKAVGIQRVKSYGSEDGAQSMAMGNNVTMDDSSSSESEMYGKAIQTTDGTSII